MYEVCNIEQIIMSRQIAAESEEAYSGKDCKMLFSVRADAKLSKPEAIFRPCT